MVQTVIDIYRNVIEFDGIEIPIVVDDDPMGWFYGPASTKLLGYSSGRDAINTFVKPEHRTTFDKLRKFVNVVPKNAQPHAVYINEYGLNSLILNSAMPKAKLFREWIGEKVVPSIIHTGQFKIEEKHRKEVDKLNKKLDTYKKEVKILKHNQKKSKYNKGGRIYILRPIDTRNPKLLKAGKTYNLTNRLYTYNTSVPDDMEVLFHIDVDDPDSVELCIKSIMKPYIYRKNKEYYETTIKKLKDSIIKCDKFVSGYIYCNKCKKHVVSANEFFQHMLSEHGIVDNSDVYVDYIKTQRGGTSNRLQNYQKYVTYRTKYLLLHRNKYLSFMYGRQIGSFNNTKYINYRDKYMKYKHKCLTILEDNK